MTRFEAVGTHQGEWQGIQPTGKRLRLKGVNIDRVRQGRIVEHWGAANSLEALMELGVVRWVKKPQRRQRVGHGNSRAKTQKIRT